MYILYVGLYFYVRVKWLVDCTLIGGQCSIVALRRKEGIHIMQTVVDEIWDFNRIIELGRI